MRYIFLFLIFISCLNIPIKENSIYGNIYKYDLYDRCVYIKYYSQDNGRIYNYDWQGNLIYFKNENGFEFRYYYKDKKLIYVILPNGNIKFFLL